MRISDKDMMNMYSKKKEMIMRQMLTHIILIVKGNVNIGQKRYHTRLEKKSNIKNKTK